MISKFGSYTFRSGSCELTRRDTPEFNEARELLTTTIRIDVSATLIDTTAAGMDAQVSQLFAAFTKTNQDFVVYLPNGSVKSQLSLYSKNALGGVRVVQRPSIDSLKGAGYVTNLPISFALEAEYLSVNAGQLFREFTESISYSSPDREDWLLCLHGQHQKQQVRELPFYQATQQGSATGFTGYPSQSLYMPLWPFAWVNKDEQPTKDAPRPRGDLFVDYKVSWNWRFKSDSPLTGEPNRWPL